MLSVTVVRNGLLQKSIYDTAVYCRHTSTTSGLKKHLVGQMLVTIILSLNDDSIIVTSIWVATV